MIKIEDGKHPVQPKGKVYCKNCIWFNRSWCPPFVEKCKHPNNWIDTWLEKVRRPPWEINKINNCKWFERSPYKPESKPD